VTKFGEKIKVRRFSNEIEKWKINLSEILINIRRLTQKEIKLLKFLSKKELSSHFKKIKRERSRPLIVRLMERVNSLD
jgi:hypothetical protein